MSDEKQSPGAGLGTPDAPYGRCDKCGKAHSIPAALPGSGPSQCGDCWRSAQRPSEALPGAAGWVHRHDTLCPLCGRRSGEHETQHQIGYMCPEPRDQRPEPAKVANEAIPSGMDRIKAVLGLDFLHGVDEVILEIEQLQRGTVPRDDEPGTDYPTAFDLERLAEDLAGAAVRGSWPRVDEVRERLERAVEANQKRSDGT